MKNIEYKKCFMEEYSNKRSEFISLSTKKNIVQNRLEYFEYISKTLNIRHNDKTWLYNNLLAFMTTIFIIEIGAMFISAVQVAKYVAYMASFVSVLFTTLSDYREKVDTLYQGVSDCGFSFTNYEDCVNKLNDEISKNRLALDEINAKEEMIKDEIRNIFIFFNVEENGNVNEEANVCSKDNSNSELKKEMEYNELIMEDFDAPFQRTR